MGRKHAANAGSLFDGFGPSPAQAVIEPAPTVNTEGWIVFTPGGPIGGHWRFEEQA